VAGRSEIERLELLASNSRHLALLLTVEATPVIAAFPTISPKNLIPEFHRVTPPFHGETICVKRMVWEDLISAAGNRSYSPVPCSARA